MNARSTWLLVLSALALFAFILLFEREPRDPESRAQSSPVLAGFRADAVTGVEIHQLTNPVLRAERTEGRWRLTHPVQTVAHAPRVERLLSVFSKLDRHSHITARDLASQKASLAAFGLDPPRATVIASQATNQFLLKIGGPTPVGQQVYIQLVGADGIYFCDAGFLDSLPRSADDWRDTTFLRLRGLGYNRLQIRTGAQNLEFKVDDATHLWRLGQPMNARADNRKIHRLIQEMEFWQITQFLPAPSAVELEALRLQPSESSITFSRGSNDLLTAHFGLSPTNNAGLVYAHCPPDPGLVLVLRAPLDSLRKPLAYWRDPRLISPLVASIDLIEIAGEESFALQRQSANAWTVAGPARLPADPETMQRFLGDLTALEVVEYVRDVVTDFAPYGLTKPARQYTLRPKPGPASPTNAFLAQINLGASYDDKYYVRLTGEDSVYGVPRTNLAGLPTRAFQFRDRSVWSFDSSNVVAVTIAIEGQTRKLSRAPGAAWVQAPGNTPLASPSDLALEETLYRLGQLRAEAWTAIGADQLPRHGFPEAAHTLTIDLQESGRARSCSIRFGRQAPSQHIFAAIDREDQTVIFEFRLTLFNLYVDFLRGLFAQPSPPAP